MKHLLFFILAFVAVAIVSFWPQGLTSLNRFDLPFMLLLILFLLDEDAWPVAIFTTFLTALVSAKPALLVFFAFLLPLLLFSALKSKLKKQNQWKFLLAYLAFFGHEFLSALFTTSLSGLFLFLAANSLISSLIIVLLSLIISGLRGRSLKLSALAS